MLSFAVYTNGEIADNVDLSGAYVVGSDDVPLRADITFEDGVIRCKKRAAGAAGLAILWKVPEVGIILTETVRVPEREKPYILQVELARGRLVRINQKVEEWGLFDYEGAEKITAQITKARELLIRALQADTPAEAAEFAEQSLAQAALGSERLSQFHAEALLARRKQSGGFSRSVFGCSINTDRPGEVASKRLLSAFDFVAVPFNWRDVEPSEQTFNWKPLDAWVDALAKHRMPIKGAALLSFTKRTVPDWLYVWENDFTTVRDLAFEHIRRVISRYGQHIQAWDVVSGLHASTCFSFNFEQLMELTRMAAAVTKQVAPKSTAVIDLVAPWGEYYARNQRTIPPLLYADMVVQSGVDFDAFGLQFHFGRGVDGMFMRDMFQTSSTIDQFGKLGKPLHITAVQVPSDIVPIRMDDDGGEEITVGGGEWHTPWSEEAQADWLRQFLITVLSKPFVESVAWCDLTDRDDVTVPHGGLLRGDLAPKQAYRRLMKMRSELTAPARRAGRPTSK